ncbi:hypothetical protein A2276_02035 [candidate division WOR-1 bacterium RIFOXYA12_FULL_43_27]|uniref:Transporter n=1 Tax=candidate division WOR-1 bacterium RIFOXYC2_FULL_46_14 TaxID=1802587 RepID=A0A1F4U6H8_UNCSA|nr:MAG: hypothetical protein A2276_02035 [candidate division WOR-1 bacterium RIFOXYA12_FULL_43_27]OGC19498.1 MAG: hypothetical protein A2292_02295 [candidate division WOR-1 bacterium RIFOXYB2_FULL_46_45]OGC30486.1 MAG: hypothetical protein A2232_02295 [candidate division WOR-1 bacterium RIFOXYA2_FULL_46_56]OGC40554.1 MAG: hypothetical protein A2438_06010 [candidate division WOR-1 bacterium RIFOXYC2_FULL_46_14]
MFFRNFRILTISTIFFLITNIAVSALTLDQALETANKNNPKTLSSYAMYEEAKTKVVQKNWLPQPDLMLEYKQIPQEARNPVNAGMYMYGFSQKLPFPYKLWLSHSSAWNMENRYKYLYEQQAWDTRADVVEAYYKLFFANRKYEINKSNLEILKRFKRVSESKYVVGKAAQSDLLTAQIQYELIKNDDETFKREISLAQTALERLLNKNTGGTTESAPKAFDFKLDLEKVKELAQKLNPMLLALKSQKNSLSDAHALSKFDIIPDIKTTVLQREIPNAGLNGWDFKLSAEIPLWFWSKAAAINEAGYTQDIVEQAYLDFKNELNQKVETVYIKLETTVRTDKIYKDSILKKTKQALSSAETAYRADRIDFLTLSNAQKMNFDAELAYYKNLVEIEIHKARLEALIGGEIK